MNSDVNNADRFIGFADVYDEARPKMPLYPVEAIKRYLGRRPERVVDLGCGAFDSGLEGALQRSYWNRTER